MDAYAVVETSGKQYRVKVQDVLRVDRMSANAGEKVEIGPVLALSDGSKLQIGTPAIAGAKVTCTVVENVRGEKVVAFKKKRRKGYRKKKGHRQELTVLKVESLS